MRYYVRPAAPIVTHKAVVTSFHRLHLSPWNGAGQRVMAHHLTVTEPHAVNAEPAEIKIRHVWPYRRSMMSVYVSIALAIPGPG